jgi:hypothetical protein
LSMLPGLCRPVAVMLLCFGWMELTKNDSKEI